MQQLNFPNMPEGYMENAQGDLVRVEQIRPIDMARHELVLEKVSKAKAMQEQLKALKNELMDDVDAFCDMSVERYGVKRIGGKKGNVSLTSFDGRFQIQRQVSEYLSFDEGLQAAKLLIDECLRDWMQGSRPELSVMVDYAFQVDKEGRINTSRILGLRRLEIQEPRWQRAMQAIGDSLQVTDTRSYVRVYERDSKGKYNAISLDMAAL